MDTKELKQQLTEQLQNKLNGGEEALHQSHVFTSAHAGDARRKRKPPRMSFRKPSPPTPLPTDGDFSLIANKRGFPILDFVIACNSCGASAWEPCESGICVPRKQEWIMRANANRDSYHKLTNNLARWRVSA